MSPKSHIARTPHRREQGIVVRLVIPAHAVLVAVVFVVAVAALANVECLCVPRVRAPCWSVLQKRPFSLTPRCSQPLQSPNAPPPPPRGSAGRRLERRHRGRRGFRAVERRLRHGALKEGIRKGARLAAQRARGAGRTHARVNGKTRRVTRTTPRGGHHTHRVVPGPAPILRPTSRGPTALLAVLAVGGVERFASRSACSVIGRLLRSRSTDADTLCSFWGSSARAMPRMCWKTPRVDLAHGPSRKASAAFSHVLGSQHRRRRLTGTPHRPLPSGVSPFPSPLLVPWPAPSSRLPPPLRPLPTLASPPPSPSAGRAVPPRLLLPSLLLLWCQHARRVCQLRTPTTMRPERECRPAVLVGRAAHPHGPFNCGLSIPRVLRPGKPRHAVGHPPHDGVGHCNAWPPGSAPRS